MRRLTTHGPARLRVLAHLPPVSQRGIGLVETLVALAIVGGAIAMFAGSLSTGARANRVVYEQVTAENVARSQIEYIQSQPYSPVPASYDILSDVPDGFAVATDVSAVPGRDANIQKVSVTISRGGKDILTLEALKLNR